MFASILVVWAIQPLVYSIQAVFGMGFISCLGSQVGPVIVRPPAKVLHHHYPALVAGRTNGRSQVLWLSRCPCPSTGSLAWLHTHRQVPSPIIIQQLIGTDAETHSRTLGRTWRTPWMTGRKSEGIKNMGRTRLTESTNQGS